MSGSGEGGVELALAEMARALEATDDPPARVLRVLELTRRLIPYARCAVRWEDGPLPPLQVFPELEGVELAVLSGRAERLLAMMTEGLAAGPRSLSASTLAVPVTGLDRVVGVLAVDPEPPGAFDERHLRRLSVVAAQLGAFFTMLKARDDEAKSALELAQAHDFQQLLVGIVSHDLRNPLSVITVGATNLLRKQPEPSLQRTLERTLRCAKKANRIIADLLDVTSARVNGELSIERRNVDLKHLMLELVEEARESHGPHLELCLRAPPDEVWGEWDADRLSQAVANLINNAVQYGDEGAPVVVSLSARSDDVAVRVTNFGPPIAEELLEVMFDPFKQGNPQQRRRGQGLGLGLYIVRQIVEAHGGCIGCHSSEREGTTFTVTLPRTIDEGREGANVLVVEDDADVRASMVEMLEGQGYVVKTAPNGARALEQLKRGLRPKVVLFDVHMPVMDGATLWTRCQEDPKLRRIPMVVVSSDRAAASRLTQEGATDFVPKPVRVEMLLRKVERLAYARAAS